MELNKPVDPGKSELGDLDGKVVALLCYQPLVLWGLVGLVFFLTEKKNFYVRFAAVQSLAAAVIGIVGSFLCGIPTIVAFVFCVIAFVKALNNEYYKMPLIGDQCEKWAALPAAVPPPPPPPAA